MLDAFFLIINGVICVISLYGFFKIQRLIRHSHFETVESSTDNDLTLPSVSVCIPARNEKHAMTQCLESVLSSNYQKMEVIVLDDSSVDNTSALIKAFARDGVRFVEGSPLPDGWIGKNHALSELLREASGTYVLFLDVDTHITTDTIRRLVTHAIQHDKEMVSVLPQRADLWRTSVLLAPLRYFWKLLTATQHHPAVTASAWIAKRHTIQDTLQSFATVASHVEPELVLAKQLSPQRYSFLANGHDVGVTYEKKLRSQYQTSVRVFFPILGASVLRTLLVVLALLTVAIAPFLAVGLYAHLAPATIVSSAVAIVVLYITYTYYLHTAWRRGSAVGGLLYPYILLQEVWLCIASAFLHITHRVTWKGRPLRQTNRPL